MLGVALKSIGYFGFQNLLVQPSEESEKIKQKFPEVSFGKAPYDFALLDHVDESLIFQMVENEELHNNSMILIKNIHLDGKQESHWKSLIANQCITVSVDHFYCGVIFLRKEQEKEHFSIRI